MTQLAQRCDEHGLVEFRSFCGDLSQAPAVGEITLDRRRGGDDLGSGRDLCELWNARIFKAENTLAGFRCDCTTMLS